MKVIHINCVYPSGSTGRITSNIHCELLKQGHKSIVLYSRGKKSNEKNIVQISNDFCGKVNHLISRFTGLVYGGCIFETLKIIYIIEKEKPDIVHLQCINGYFVNVYRLVEFLKKKRIPTVLTLHAEFMYTANCGCSYGCEKWMTGCGKCPQLYKATESYVGDKTRKSFLIMQKAFHGFEKNLIVIGVSDWLCNRAALSPIMHNCSIQRIYNGIDTKIFSSMSSENIRNQFEITRKEKIVLWVTSIYSSEKGKEYFLQLASLMRKNNYCFWVVGTDRPDDYYGEIFFWGKVSNPKKLVKIYSAADVVVCCSKQESYPTVLLEAQCCGTPVVGFDVGGVAEAIFEGMGEVVTLGDVKEMCNMVEKWSNKKSEISADTINQCVRYFSSKRMENEYIHLYKTILDKSDYESKNNFKF